MAAVSSTGCGANSRRFFSELWRPQVRGRGRRGRGLVRPLLLPGRTRWLLDLHVEKQQGLWGLHDAPSPCHYHPKTPPPDTLMVGAGQQHGFGGTRTLRP